ncbi:DUF1593 domain-containing protein [Aspergillus alliaceus]|uniref:DUF1593 domain-containing protein n=1 Tax=Petromyces alliaceus TaxID=209559 RepID=UPI0012A54B85|nr:uncharacterized protein BDW43DRAFT_301792 [Aspergillus alliaceus]KAB8231341.1 hypothetical protein BDW43DRAFT_301792 [Aspergillus alliaceus]
MTATNRDMYFQYVSSLLTDPHKPGVFILSDISNESDDQESLTRYFLYSNQFQTEGLVASTSSTPTRTPNTPRETTSGAYGMQALLLNRLQTPSTQPLWVLTQALYKIHQTLSPSEATAIRSRLRVYAISDQDDTGAWIRRNCPDIFYISTHGWNQYGLAAWIAISGETYYVTHEWLLENIQIGPYGSVAYPVFKYIMEDDGPTFLVGRYSKVDPSTGVGYNYHSDAPDRGFRQWSLLGNVSRANRHPVVVVLNGSVELAPFRVTVKAGYKEPGSDDLNVAKQVPALNLTTVNSGRQVKVDIPPSEESRNEKGDNPSGCWLVHLILKVKDNGVHPLTTYRRLLIQTTNETIST